MQCKSMMVIHMGPGHRYNHGHLKLHGSLCCDLVMTGASEDHQHPRSSVDLWKYIMIG